MEFQSQPFNHWLYSQSTPNRHLSPQVDFGLAWWEAEEKPGVRFHLTYFEATQELVALESRPTPADREREWIFLGHFKDVATVTELVKPILDVWADTHNHAGTLEWLVSICQLTKGTLNDAM